MQHSFVTRIGSFLLATLLAGALTSAGCADEGTPIASQPLAGLTFELYSSTVGIHPDKAVLFDPNNPFVPGAVDQDNVWKIQASTGAVAGFYAWATLLARGPNGERQYYVALDLKAIYEQSLANPDQLEEVRALAIRAFQNMLDQFPTAVTYDATGTIAFDLSTPCVENILALGGTPVGWILLTNSEGNHVAVRK